MLSGSICKSYMKRQIMEKEGRLVGVKAYKGRAQTEVCMSMKMKRVLEILEMSWINISNLI